VNYQACFSPISSSKATGLSLTLARAQHPGNHVVLDRHAFKFLQTLRLRVVPADDFFRMLVAFCGLVNNRLHLLRFGVQLLFLDQLGQDQTESDAALGLISKPLAAASENP
jgi:hypothetical protein